MHDYLQLVEALSISSLHTLEIYEKAKKVGRQEMCYQTYSVWYLLMVRSMIENQIQDTITQCETKLRCIETLQTLRPTVEEKITQAANTSLETKYYRNTLKTIEKDIERNQEEVEYLKETLRLDVEKFLQCLRAPQDSKQVILQGMGWFQVFPTTWVCQNIPV